MTRSIGPRPSPAQTPRRPSETGRILARWGSGGLVAILIAAGLIAVRSEFVRERPSAFVQTRTMASSRDARNASQPRHATRDAFRHEYAFGSPPRPSVSDMSPLSGEAEPLTRLIASEVAESCGGHPVGVFCDPMPCMAIMNVAVEDVLDGCTRDWHDQLGCRTVVFDESLRSAVVYCEITHPGHERMAPEEWEARVRDLRTIASLAGAGDTGASSTAQD